ncbi:MAG: biotin/lipoyl-binding protein [Armatimonadetes bacterium]|jgi:acetyl/propionyl-CoA carboxylase alpha subunit|nr:biotin/lipoyl-binding protein [Armatimonadota bacterium]
MKRIVNGEEVELLDAGVNVEASGEQLVVRVDGERRTAVAVKRGDQVLVSYQGRQYVVEKQRRRAGGAGAAAAGTLTAPMPGAIVAVLVEEGQAVTKGERLVVLEAMKTQQPFLAPTDGTVKSVPVSVGQQVSEGQVLVVVEP